MPLPTGATTQRSLENLAIPWQLQAAAPLLKKELPPAIAFQEVIGLPFAPSQPRQDMTEWNRVEWESYDWTPPSSGKGRRARGLGVTTLARRVIARELLRGRSPMSKFFVDFMKGRGR